MCDITRGKNVASCKDAVSGLKAIYVANYSDYGFVTGASASTGLILSDLGTLDEVFKYELKNSGNTYNQAITSSRDNGTTFFSPVINFILTKIGPEMEFQIKMFAVGRPIIFVEMEAKDESGVNRIFVIGKDRGCEISGSAGVGGTLDSLNGYTLTATAMELDPVYYLDSASVTALKALVSTDNIAG